MATENNTTTNRFFSHSSLFEKNKSNSKQQKEPTPFGLNLKEPIPEQKQPNKGATVGPSATNMPTGPDSCVDVDFEF